MCVLHARAVFVREGGVRFMRLVVEFLDLSAEAVLWWNPRQSKKLLPYYGDAKGDEQTEAAYVAVFPKCMTR